MDLLCYGMVWNHDLNINFRAEGVKEKVGLSKSYSNETPSQRKQTLKILPCFPKLQSQQDLIRFPENNNTKSPNRSRHLFRLVIPYLTTRNFDFCGITASLNTSIKTMRSISLGLELVAILARYHLQMSGSSTHKLRPGQPNM